MTPGRLVTVPILMPAHQPNHYSCARRRTATSIKNALLKAKNFDFYDMRVDDSNFKTSYKEGDKLDLKDLKVTIYKKNNQKITVSYSDFGKYGLKVVDEYNKELKDGLVLNKENLGYNVTDGLRLKVVHEESKSFKFLNTILISKSTTKNFEISGIKIKAKDGSEWYDTKGYNTTDFIQNLTVSKEVAEKLNNKEIEFKIIAKDKKSSEEIEIPLRQALKSIKVYYSIILSVSKQKLKERFLKHFYTKKRRKL